MLQTLVRQVCYITMSHIVNISHESYTQVDPNVAHFGDGVSHLNESELEMSHNLDDDDQLSHILDHDFDLSQINDDDALLPNAQ